MRMPLLVMIAAVSLAGCAASIGGPGPMGAPGVPGPPGAAGPQGPANAGPMRLKLVRSAVDISVPDDIDVIITDGAAVTVRLPPATAAGNGRAITVRAFGGRASIIVSGNDVIDSRPTHALDRGEMMTVISDGDRRWIIISSSDL